MAKSRSYQQDLFKALQNPQEAQEYLNAALEEPSPEVFLLAQQDVIEANKEKEQLDLNRRVPHPDLAGKVQILGEIFDGIPATDWENLQ